MILVIWLKRLIIMQNLQKLVMKYQMLLFYLPKIILILKLQELNIKQQMLLVL